MSDAGHNLCMAIILKEVSDIMSVPVPDIMGQSRKQNVSLARHICMYYVYKLGHTVGATGKLFNRHHSLISHAVKNINNWREYDPHVQDIIQQVEEALPELNRNHKLDYQI